MRERPTRRSTQLPAGNVTTSSPGAAAAAAPPSRPLASSSSSSPSPRTRTKRKPLFQLRAQGSAKMTKVTKPFIHYKQYSDAFYMLWHSPRASAASQLEDDERAKSSLTSRLSKDGHHPGTKRDATRQHGSTLPRSPPPLRLAHIKQNHCGRSSSSSSSSSYSSSGSSSSSISSLSSVPTSIEGDPEEEEEEDERLDQFTNFVLGGLRAIRYEDISKRARTVASMRRKSGGLLMGVEVALQ
ncbi:BQ2448_1982 [Microbotryum intermedium]|uniref:BQ2448_1982 protein n=1 Tax=Microbotryum intermedium TaxID=269621 RepID=A0A238F4S3_9BASI|nr:BQ2448_1982 [Microbotryum intermedium]